jgi:hypothetical protein
VRAYNRVRQLPKAEADPSPDPASWVVYAAGPTAPAVLVAAAAPAVPEREPTPLIVEDDLPNLFLNDWDDAGDDGSSSDDDRGGHIAVHGGGGGHMDEEDLYGAPDREQDALGPFGDGQDGQDDPKIDRLKESLAA